VRQHVEACFAALDARLARALDEAAAVAEPGSGAPVCRTECSRAQRFLRSCLLRVRPMYLLILTDSQ